MRISNLIAGIASVAALLPSLVGGTAASPLEVYRQQDEVQSAVLHNLEHHARDPQDSDDFLSYDYGYSGPPPPPPTTYGEESSTEQRILNRSQHGDKRERDI
ncbi:hypothetical protein CGCS363_v012571 [Colletotrichum siamense]|uniref:uncharacterized protein n=1 Tax=Colletotrichum siamense TaxID=690259 RepID=UPI0018723304|nr:uncharacterized protein CGCS363_v012571 [Colletotrichum siamense]KAF5489910.1 hypothetical protein CGCS363_v012571 [Colletotrichum siamense]